MSKFSIAFSLTILAALLLAGAFFAGYFFDDYLSAGQDFSILQEAHRILIQHGLKDPPGDPALEYGMIHGMVQAYGDPYTSFVEPPQNELQTNSLEGKFGGIGVQLSQDEQGYWVMFPIPDSPASQAGIREGDRLLAVDEMPINPDTPSDTIQSAVRGPVGQIVTITAGRPPDFQPVEYKIKRQEIALPSVTWHLDVSEPGIGIIKVNLMAASTADEIKRAINDLEERGARRYILDLRDNPGGYLSAGVDIARLFLSEGIVMEEQYRGKDVETHTVGEPGPFADLPLAVLINEGSASAAEIAAGALQAQGRAPLIGTHSFGKDTVQLVFNLKDGSSLHVTAAHWWIPELAGPLAGNGLQPDIPVEEKPDESSSDPILQTAVDYLLTK